MFCEIKDDDEVTLLPGDDDYISPDQSCESKDGSSIICNNIGLGDKVPTQDDCFLAHHLTKARSRDTVYNYSESSVSNKDSGSESAAILMPLPIGESLSSLRQMCDLCVGPSPIEDEDVDYGAMVTVRNSDRVKCFRDAAELALKFYNDTKWRNFKLVKVCKANIDGYLYHGLTFRAQEDGSLECPLFRGVVYLYEGRTAMFCEIKDDDEITLLPSDDDYVSPDQSCDSKDASIICNNIGLGNKVPTQDDCFLAHHLIKVRTRDTVYNYSDSSGSDKDSGSESTAILMSLPIGESLSSLRQMCDLCVGPPPIEDEDVDYGAMVTVRNSDRVKCFRDAAELALKFYNDTKWRNFKLVKVCKANTDCYLYHGLTFRAQEDGSVECPLFRGVVYLYEGRTAMFCEIKDDDEVTLLPGDDDYVSPDQSYDSKDDSSCNNIGLGDKVPTQDDCFLAHHLTKARSRDTVYNYSESSVSDKDSGSESAAILMTLPIGESLSSLRQMCDLCVGPSPIEDEDEDYGAMVTVRNADRVKCFRDAAELALKFYNDTKWRNFKLVKVCKANIDGYLCHGLTFRAQEDGSVECPLFRGVVYLYEGRTAMFCEIKDDDEITLLPGDDDYVSSD